MHDAQKKVTEFFLHVNHSVGKDTALPSNYAIVHLRRQLIQEEVKELFNAIVEENMIEIIDALCDLIYVTYGMAVSFGIDIEPYFNEVHRTNMLKNPEITRRDGKILKPPGWSEPDLEKIFHGHKSNVE